MHRFFTVLYGAAGVAHFLRPQVFDQIVPARLPGAPRWWTYASGAAELAVAGLMARPQTRRTAGYASAALLVAVFPANAKMAWDWRDQPARRRAIAYGRLPLQLPLIWWSVRVAREAPVRGGD